jgi:hypothetical protein
MTIDFGQLRSALATQAHASRPPAAPGPAFADVGGSRAPTDLDRIDIGIPSSPPPDVLDAIAAAAARARELAEANRELHFRRDEASGRIIVEVRDFDGNVVRTIPPSKALDVMAGLYGTESA